MATKKKRIKEPSTWAGISGALAALASMPIPGAQPWLAGLVGRVGWRGGRGCRGST